MGSSRLPGKSMMNICGIPLCIHIMRRLKHCKNNDLLIASIPKTKKDDILYKTLISEKFKVFRGPTNNLVKRYSLTAKKFNSNIIVRFPGDNCIPDPNEIDKIIKFYLKKKDPSLFASNICNFKNNKYPDGIGAEIFSLNLLQKIQKTKLSKIKKEHIHKNFINYKLSKNLNKKICNIDTIKCRKEISDISLKLDVNNIKDFNYIEDIYNNLYYKNNYFKTQDVIKYLKTKS